MATELLERAQTPETQVLETPIQVKALSECMDCDQHTPQKTPGFIADGLNNAFYRGLEVCLDEVRQEPKKILVVGGNRQFQLSRYIALLLPYARMFTVDNDEKAVEKAKNEIQCRLNFYHAPLESLPFDDRTFDLTLAHNFFEFPENWETALGEVARVTKENLIISTWQPGALGWIPGVSELMDIQGTQKPKKQPKMTELLPVLRRHGKTLAQVSPFPWELRSLALRER